MKCAKFTTLVLIILVGCIQQNNSTRKMLNSDSEKNNEKQLLDTNISIELKECISNYIEEVDKHFFDKEWLYYNVFFFNKDSKQYFTIWAFTCFPEYISLCVDTSLLNYYLYNIKERKVILIDKNKSTAKLFNHSKHSYILAEEEALKKYLGDIYDGPLFPQTYKIKERDNKIFLIKIEDSDTSFLDCQDLEIVDEN